MDEINKELAKTFLVPFENAEQLRNWVLVFFGLDMPIGHIDPDSNSSPVEWMFDAYKVYRDNQGGQIPGFIVLSSRESYKTLTESMLVVILMAHFGCTIAHLAAIEFQASKAIQYINTFVTRIKPYLEFHGRKVDAQSKRKVSITQKDGSLSYVSVIIATMTGANSEHCNILSIDEIDLMRFPQAYEEAKLIPGVMAGQHPITIKTSTRKFAFGLMQQEIDNVENTNEKLLRWNIIDVTEKCGIERHISDTPDTIRYISRKLPLTNISEDEYNALILEKKIEFDKIMAYTGCKNCVLLPVCKRRLAERPATDVGGLYKPIDFVINQFNKISPDMAEAQLMCWKPSSTGLVYPRFDETERTGNTLTVAQAWNEYTGSPATSATTVNTLISLMIQRGVKFYAGVDWGYRHNFAIVVGAILPNKDFWMFETLAVPGLEFPEMMRNLMHIRDKYRIAKWFCDTAQPSFIASMRKNRMPCKDFKKDIMGGIESIRGQITDASGKRSLKVIKTEENDILIKMYRHHHFKLDAAGRPTTEPDDEEYADIADATRYMGQNLFIVKGNIRTGTDGPDRDRLLAQQRQLMYQNDAQRVHSEFISQKIQELSGNSTEDAGKSTGIYWDFSDPLED